MVAITVLPLQACFLSSLTICRALKLSRPEVGSSSRIIEGSVMSSTPMAVLFLSPPEIDFFLVEPTWVSATCSRPSSPKSSSTLRSYSAMGKFNLSRAANLRDSLGE